MKGSTALGIVIFIHILYFSLLSCRQSDNPKIYSVKDSSSTPVKVYDPDRPTAEQARALMYTTLDTDYMFDKITQAISEGKYSTSVYSSQCSPDMIKEVRNKGYIVTGDGSKFSTILTISW